MATNHRNTYLGVAAGLAGGLLIGFAIGRYARGKNPNSTGSDSTCSLYIGNWKMFCSEQQFKISQYDGSDSCKLQLLPGDGTVLYGVANGGSATFGNGIRITLDPGAGGQLLSITGGIFGSAISYAGRRD